MTVIFWVLLVINALECSFLISKKFELTIRSKEFLQLLSEQMVLMWNQ